MMRRSWHGSVLVLLLLIMVSLTAGLAASNKVPKSGVGLVAFPINANALKPPECAGLDLTDIVLWTSSSASSGNSSLILGGPAADQISAGKGADCILGGGGDDTLSGNQGKDVCIGGPGNDSFHTCETEYP